MKLLAPLCTVFAVVFVLGCGQQGSSTNAGRQTAKKVDASRKPLEVVNERMGAYNRHDIDAFMGVYDEGIEIQTYSGKSLGKGKQHIRSIFAPMFRDGRVHVEIHHQIVKDSFVVNHETVTNGSEATEYVSIYEVKNGLIRSVQFVRD